MRYLEIVSPIDKKNFYFVQSPEPPLLLRDTSREP